MAETNAEKIIAQAHEWNFQGDCSLLDWMKQISQNLEQRTSSTIGALERLNVTVKQTSTALDNAANSFTALQYTQFVESRVHDEDETNANTTTEVLDAVSSNDKVEQSSGVILKTFLGKNLEMLRNCHEKYTLDFDDSDEEEGANNCIYQPRNPYNDHPLPHIFGSKLWKENWHVGLCDGANDYSGDEVSEAFSESSTTSHSTAEDNESYNSNTPANLSEWASNTSLSHDKYLTTPAAIAAQNDSSLRGSQPLFPPVLSRSDDKQTRPFAAGSDTSSTTSRTTLTRHKQNNAHDLFDAVQNTPPTSASSSLSSSAATLQQTPLPQSVHDTQSSSASSGSKNTAAVPAMFFDQIPEDDLFAGTNAASESGPTKTASKEIQRKPVNLFDDDDFNSFMSDIVEVPTPAPMAAARSTLVSATVPTAATKEIIAPVVLERESKKAVDIFHIPVKEAENAPQLVKQVVSEKVTEHFSRRPLNLFESPEVSPTNESLFPTAIQGNKNVHFGERTKMNVKSLFDDDEDDDDDFLNIFGSKSINISKANETQLLFDVEDVGNKNEQISTSGDNAYQKNLETRNYSKPGELFIDKTFVTSNKEVSTVGNRKFFEDDALQDAKLKTSLATVVKNTTDLFAKTDDDFLNESENKQINSTAATMQKDIENNAPPILDDCVQVINNVEDTIKNAAVSNLIGYGSEQNNKKSIDSTANNICEQKPSTLEDKLAKVEVSPKLSHNRSNLFEEPDEFDDLFDKPKRHNSKKSHLSEQTEVPKVIKETDNQFSTIQNKILPVEITHSSAASTEVEEYSLNDPETSTLSIESSHVTNLSTHEPEMFVKSAEGEVQDAIEQSLKPDSTLISNNSSIKESLTNVAATHSYTGLFLDEPPDDDDFFQTLQGSGAKLSLDLEHDLYEPVLPQPPNNTKSDGVAKTDTAATVNDYAGLCLFSDVPPDDDDALNADGGTSKTSKTKRLHSVFYDDFNETLEAVKQHPSEISRPTHALFDNEPPPDERNFEVTKKPIDTVDTSVSIKKNITKDVLHTKVLQKQSSNLIEANLAEISQDNQMFKKPTKDKVEEATIDIKKIYTAVEEIAKIAKTREITSISKLQMPNININVQALLPNAGGKPNLQRFSPEESRNFPEISDIVHPVYTEPIAQEPKENILTSVCKTRVRAPAQRRPSTRRGRQEKYRKSLLEEEEDNLVEPGKNEVQSNEQINDSITKVKRNQQTEIGTTKQPNELSPKTNKNTKYTETVISTSVSINQRLTELFPNNEDDDGFIFNAEPKTLASSNVQNRSKDLLFLPNAMTPPEDTLFAPKPVVKKSVVIEEKLAAFPIAKSSSSALKLFENDDDSDLFERSKNGAKHVDASVKSASKDAVAAKLPEQSATQPSNKAILPIATTTRQFKEATSLFADEQSDSDDDLFKSTKPSRTSRTSPPPPKRAAIKEAASLFGSDEDTERNDDFMSALRKSGPSKGATRKIPIAKQEPSSDKGLFSDVESDGDDDLFSGGSVKTTTKVATKPLQNPLSKQAQASALPTTTSASMLENNPLADLLNS